MRPIRLGVSGFPWRKLKKPVFDCTRQKKKFRLQPENETEQKTEKLPFLVDCTTKKRREHPHRSMGGLW